MPSRLAFNSIVILLIVLSSCSKFFNREDTSPYDPIVSLIKEPIVIVDVDTLVFSVKKESGLSRIIVDLEGTNERYDFKIEEKPFQLILKAEDFISDDYGYNILVLNTNIDTVSNFSGNLTISNPDEETFVISPLLANNYDDVWVLVEDTDHNILQYGIMDRYNYYRVQLSENKIPENNTYNLHFIYKKGSESKDDNNEIIIRSIFGFQGRYFNPVYYDSIIVSNWKQEFEFINLPVYDDYFVGHPFLYSSYNFDKIFKAIFNTYENDVYVYVKNSDVYCARLFQNLWKENTVLDLSEMDTISDICSISLIGNRPSIDVFFLKDQKPKDPRVKIASLSSLSDTTITFPLTSVFTAHPFFESKISFDPINGMDHKYIYYGQLPESVKIKDAECWYIKDNRITEIKTKYKFDYLTGFRNFKTSGIVHWQFITNEKSVMMPEFPEEISSIIPELKAFSDGSFNKVSSCVNMITYSNFSHYYKLLENFDLHRFIPVDYESHNLFTFSKTINY